MKGIYLMLAAVFITLMISPAAYSTESSDLSMGYFKEMESNVTVYVDANTSTSDEKLGVWDIPVSELTVMFQMKVGHFICEANLM